MTSFASERPSPGDDAGLAKTVRAKCTALLMRGHADVAASVFNAGLVTATLWRFYPPWVIWLWLGVICTTCVHRELLRNGYRQATSEVRFGRRWACAFAWNAFAGGCFWGLTASIFLITTDIAHQAFVVFVLGGMAAGAMVISASDFRSMFAYTAPVILPALAILFTRGAPAQTELGLMLAAFAAANIIGGWTINTAIVHNIRLRAGEDSLSDALGVSEAAMAEAEAIAHVGTWISDLRTGRVAWSDEVFRILGADKATFKPSYESMLGRVHPEDRLALERRYAEMMPLGKPFADEHRLLMDDGVVKYVNDLARFEHDESGQVTRMHGSIQDISVRITLQQKLYFTNLVLKSHLEASLDAIIVVDAAQRLILYNRNFATMWGADLADLEAGDHKIVLAKMKTKIRDPDGFDQRVRYLYAHPNEDASDNLEMVSGHYIERYTTTLHNKAGGYIGRAWFYRDVTKRREDEATALRMARADALTGLPNRAVFVEMLQRAIAGAERDGTRFAVLYLDLDYFKDVNDTLGHTAGDQLLAAVAERMRSIIRASDTVARFGGDEFAIIAGDIAGPSAAAVLADKLVKLLAEPFEIAGRQVHSGASIGIDVFGPGAGDAETLLAHADVALYRSKGEGRGGYRFFAQSMDTDVRARVSLAGELHTAIDSDQLFLVYQPQVALETGRITGLEALVRWRHPTRGVLGPDLFIPVAEQMGLVAKLGHWVLWAACRQAKTWRDAGIPPVRMCVNLSALQFRSPLALEADIMAALAETALSSNLLELELTETVLMNASRDHSDVLLRLRNAGASIAIDDFGTGYSSLDYLRRFPATRIKIAQNFVKNLQTSPGDAAIVKATIGLAHELGIAVIAEGVETRAQFEMLKAWGCAEVQGFYFARPLAAENVGPLLRDGGTLLPRAGADAPEKIRRPSSPVPGFSPS